MKSDPNPDPTLSNAGFLGGEQSAASSAKNNKHRRKKKPTPLKTKEKRNQSLGFEPSRRGPGGRRVADLFGEGLRSGSLTGSGLTPRRLSRLLGNGAASVLYLWRPHDSQTPLQGSTCVGPGRGGLKANGTGLMSDSFEAGFRSVTL